MSRIEDRHAQRIQEARMVEQNKAVQKSKDNNFQQILNAQKNAKTALFEQRHQVLKNRQENWNKQLIVPNVEKADHKIAGNKSSPSASKDQVLQKNKVAKTAGARSSRNDEKLIGQQQKILNDKIVLQVFEKEKERDGHASYAESANAFEVGPKPGELAMAKRYVAIEEELGSLVDDIYIGLNKEQKKECVIDLKKNVLGGSRIHVTTVGNRVSLNFVGLDKGTQLLITRSRATLDVGLDSKGLSLNKMTFS